MNIDEEIVEWSMQAFPDLTVEKQLLKLSEEIEELCQSKCAGKEEEALYELADVYIVSRILADRFDDAIGRYFVGLLINHPTPKAMEAVREKMKKNKARKWVKGNGTYHHKEEK